MQDYFLSKFFTEQLVNKDKRSLEFSSYAAPRAGQCLWLEVQLASVSKDSFFWLIANFTKAQPMDML